jgi:probable F420-dependent oxidoreductase
MRVGLAFASAAYTGAAECEQMVEIAEGAGLESVWAVEHVLTPAALKSSYPYTADGDIDLSANFCDPVVWLSYIAGLSKTLCLGTGVMILPQRHPAYVAKEWATLDRLSGGRAILGVGVGWLREETEALGQTFATRGRRTDECIRAIRSLWAHAPSSFDGEFFTWSKMTSFPKPVRLAGVPIIIGGHSHATAKRVARLGDGFFWPGHLSDSVATTPDQPSLEEMLAVVAAECAEVGRDRSEIEVTVGANRPTIDELQELHDLGVTRIVIAPAPLDRLADRVAVALEAIRDAGLSVDAPHAREVTEMTTPVVADVIRG